MSAGNDEVRYTRLLRRVLWFALGVAAATVGMVWATLLTTGQAAAQPLNVPGIGVIDVPSQVAVPEGVEQGLHLVPAVPQPNSNIEPRIVIGAAHVPEIVRSAVGFAADPAVAHPAATPVPGAGEIVPGRGLGHFTVAATPAIAHPAIALAPAPAIAGFAAAPAVPTEFEHSFLRAFTFTPGSALAPNSAPDPNATPGAAQPGLPALPPVLDIPQVRQFLSAPQFRGLTLPGLKLPTPPALSAPQTAPTPRETTGERALDAARSKLGSAYRYGSAGPNAFDCSGLVQWSYRQAGVALPRTSYAQLDSGTPVPLNQLRPGDVVSFYGGEHSAIYAGNGRVIHASTETTGVIESPISQMPVAGARRF